ncbi:acyl-CoA dehydrogenase family protein [Pseudomonas eucalypticola]|uniref:Acyl-CoA dehydrogenase family protein n=1 Tax=Pseudomonas eucalypticola TaxID=2599595 RepID=A0A7D5D8J1_9PSED|nr:acyl-CoA dehydrogenase family protein [Pseudomonas eucalypticola]QKZ05600.1 acyl-CoA dehydrogenase family protein [Pseudomonas eucalypticola]
MNRVLTATLQRPAAGYPDAAALHQALQALVADGLDRLALPGSGRTLERWRCLAVVAGQDLGLCKFYEGHTDALAIMAELAAPKVAVGSTWGTWAAEPPNARVTVKRDGDRYVLNGRKAWCSGAGQLSHALLTAWDEHGQQQLVAVALRQPGVTVVNEGWQAVGMGATASIQVQFDDAEGTRVGGPGEYLERPGFWQGAIGIAACWYGAAQQLAQRLQAYPRDEPHARAHLGAVDSALFALRTVLRQTAASVDAAPDESCEYLARRVRAVAEHACEQTLIHVGHALGAGPYCLDAHFARLAADLPVFLRQSHAERDLAQLGALASQASISELNL